MENGRPSPRRRPGDELSDAEKQEIFADQARVARESALSDEELEAFEKRPRLRGPVWIILPLFALAVVTLPIWGVFALAHRNLTVPVAAALVVGWRMLAVARKRKSQRG